MAIDSRVKELCRGKNMTLADIAEKIGVSASSLSQIMKGNPTLSKLQDIASALDVSVAELFEPQDEAQLVGRCPHCGKPIKIKVE